LRPYHFAPLAVALAAAAAAVAVAHHPLHTWPDGLGTNFHMPFSVPIAAVWHEEQMRSGIGALDPAWGALRLASLFSCAVVWIVASVVLRERLTKQTSTRSEALSRLRPAQAATYPSD
ncbi:MAG: hypothetical protein IAI49_05965, partial [Candidatus Eremiobacteraeota bacterium]|nr:hypothetical protein [Candidatus Eremiobacteraeota bacterium]